MPGAGLADLLAFLGVLMLTGGLALLALAGAAGLVAACGPPGGGYVASSYVAGGGCPVRRSAGPGSVFLCVAARRTRAIKRALQGTTRRARVLTTLTLTDAVKVGNMKQWER
jgi:hypothetical protein